MDITFEDGGKPDGKPVIYLHGAFGTRHEGCYYHEHAAAHDLRFVSTDRPGVGGTPFQPHREVLDIAAHVQQVADHLDIDEFVIAGHSNGGMYAMAAAHALPHRVLGAIVINPTLPVSRPEVWSTLSMVGRYLYSSASKGSEQSHERSKRYRTRPRAIARAGDGSIKARDLTLIRDTPAGHLPLEVRNGMSDWGFDHTGVAQPVVFFGGTRDPGTRYARTWAQQLPDGRFEEFKGYHNTHFTAPEVLERIARSAGLLPRE